MLPAQRREVELTQRLRPIVDVGEQPREEAATRVAADPAKLPLQAPGGAQPLLHRYDEDQRRLPVGPGPEGAPDGCHMWTHPWYPGAQLIAGEPPSGHLNLRAGDPARLGAGRAGDRGRRGVPGETAGLQGGHPVERSLRAARLEQRHPPLLPL